ncbi:MAG: cation:proton antiporter subunit C [Myxococcota bacterium]
MTGLIAAGDVAHAAAESISYNYWLVIVLMMTGLYVVLARSNMIKTIIGLNLFQVAVIMFYITMGKVAGGTAPIELPTLTKARVELEGMRDHLTQSDPKAPTKEELVAIVEMVRVAGEKLPTEGMPGQSLRKGADRAEEMLNTDWPNARTEVVRSLDHLVGSVVVYSNPLPHVLMLTAIVVGIATIALALALVVRINEAYDTIEEDEILALEAQP